MQQKHPCKGPERAKQSDTQREGWEDRGGVQGMW